MCLALFDSGSTYSCIQPALAKRLGRPEALPEPMEFGTAKKRERLEAKEAEDLAIISPTEEERFKNSNSTFFVRLKMI